ncbi:hypothetical protein MTO96_031816 [Rhipicephalus appendiculatus]
MKASVVRPRRPWFAEAAENENAADVLAVPTVECGLTQGDDEDARPGPPSSVALVSGTTLECVIGKQGDWYDCDQDDAPRQRKKLQLKPRSVPVEANQGGRCGAEGRQGCTSGLVVHFRRSATRRHGFPRA